MEKKLQASSLSFLLFLLLLPTTFTGIVAINELYGIYNGTAKLFVFGDSYVDTGNSPKPGAGSWKQPYGSTFPQKPVGRFSNGRVLTDYISMFLRIRSPTPFKWRRYVNKTRLRYGMNFAYGGTGVFNTLVNLPNMTTQIDFFQKLIQENAYTKQDLDSSIALVSVAGNDYTNFLVKNRSLEKLPAFTASLVNQISLNLKRIQSLGVKKIAVTGLEPLGCLPQISVASAYQNCIEPLNLISNTHNQMLLQAVQNLTHEISDGTVFMMLDLNGAFMTAINNLRNHTGRIQHLKFAFCCVRAGMYLC
ncbi:GDSL esterase/lipase [Quillaja saponaria]|uniref:GDSL esterase/lipase n=1 Tax=Quillaja saponaria TaxID=32244 RepID=A0AAD7VGQ3_QUISA|nr:GDSL esterase/lipase [Quillaja saponaria]